MNVIAKFLLAISFVTCLPLARVTDEDPELLSGLAKYLPAVGVLIGLILLSCYGILKFLHAPSLLAAVALWLTWLLVTGGIHLDGLMDTADGVLSHRSRERMLEIMRDSRVGNFGVLAALSVVLLKCAALFIVFEQSAWFMLILIPCWARWCETFAIGAFDYIRAAGMGKIWHDTTSFPQDVLLAGITCAITTVGISIIANSWLPVFSVLCCIAAGLSVAFFIRQILGGHTGDTYGCVVEIAEAGGIFCAAFALR